MIIPPRIVARTQHRLRQNLRDDLGVESDGLLDRSPIADHRSAPRPGVTKHFLAGDTGKFTKPVNARRSITFGLIILLLGARQMPAPIQEIPESPTPVPAFTNTPKPKKSPAKPKPTPLPNEPGKTPNRSPSVQPSRFAGKWVGTMPEVPWGNVATELIVDPSESTMEWQESGRGKGRSVAKLNADTLQASFQVGVTATWSLTPQPDGATARVRLQAFMNDQTAIFHRTVASSK
jgi:hypothetical protein